MVDHDHFEGGGFAGYIRVSPGNTDADVQRSVAAQKEAMQEFVQQNGSGNIVWYVEVGKGSALPALQALLADAKAPDRGFDTVLVYSFARLSRDMVEFHAIRLGLREVGVELVSVSEDGVSSTPTDRLIESIIQAVNDYHRRFDDHCRERHSQATRRGIEGARRRREGC